MKKSPNPVLRLADDQLCFGCGAKNGRGLHLKFTLDEKRRVIKSRWIPTKEFQGYADIIHGGMIALILDEVMVNFLWKLENPSVTGEMTVRFHRPARVGEPIDFEAHVGSQKGRLFQMKGTAKTSAGRLIASASASCIRVKIGA